MHWYGKEAPYNVLILDRLGLTLEDSISKRHDISFIFSLANQMVFPFSVFYNNISLIHLLFLQLSCLESLHSRNYIHRDVKPANFMTGAGELSNQVFLIDFGLAQLFRDPSTRRHVPFMSGLKTVGTIAFTSINSHSGRTQSRRDDLESLMYSIVYLFCGCLPWQDVIEGPVEQYEAAVLEKKTASVKTLCQGLPLPFVAFTQHIQSLGFDEKPQYDYLHALLTQCSANDSNDVVSNLVTIPPSLRTLTVPSLPHGQRM